MKTQTREAVLGTSGPIQATTMFPPILPVTSLPVSEPQNCPACGESALCHR